MVLDSGNVLTHGYCAGVDSKSVSDACWPDFLQIENGKEKLQWEMECAGVVYICGLLVTYPQILLFVEEPALSQD